MAVAKFVIIALVIGVVAYYVQFNLQQPTEVKVPENGWFGTGRQRPDNNKIANFQVNVPEEVIKDLQARVRAARISHNVLEDAADSFHYGFNERFLRKVQSYWSEQFDWKKQEQILNSFDQFTTEIEGIDVHFYHVKPPANKYQKVLPLLIVHGWPGSVFEFYKLLPLLSDPASHRLGNQIAFEVVAPSIPGYGFSGQPKKTGFSGVAAARVFKKLMLRLKFNKFYLQGGDWGAAITSNIARMYPQNALGLHLNTMYIMPGNSAYTTFLSLFGSYLPKFIVKESFEGYDFFKLLKDLLVESGYMHLQATKPDTIGTALNDSPLGLAAYILEKYSTWTNLAYRDLLDGGLTEKFTLDELLTQVTIYWTQGNIVSSQRFYKEFFLEEAQNQLNRQYVIVPTGHAHFANDFADSTPSMITKEFFNLTSRFAFPDGGHFAALEQPKFLAQHLFNFVLELENNYFP